MQNKKRIEFSIEQITNSIAKNKAEIFKSKVVTFINPYSYLCLRKMNVDLKNFDKIGIDGISLVLLLKIFNIEVDRISFDYGSIAKKYFELLGNESHRLVIIGSDEGSNHKFAEHLKEDFNLNIVYARNGYFETNEVLSQILEKVISYDPTHIVIGMGGGLQEMVCNMLIEKGYKENVITCGGFIHQTAKSKNISYYPEYINRLNLRGIYRMYKEPKVIKRVAVDYPIALTQIAFQIIKYKINSLRH
jgi:N-acetylglucosaminyldiphosphoundecaprenol N-acetyl-beta-D-mannosaminyltransferase